MSGCGCIFLCLGCCCGCACACAASCIAAQCSAACLRLPLRLLEKGGACRCLSDQARAPRPSRDHHLKRCDAVAPQWRSSRCAFFVRSMRGDVQVPTMCVGVEDKQRCVGKRQTRINTIQQMGMTQNPRWYTKHTPQMVAHSSEGDSSDMMPPQLMPVQRIAMPHRKSKAIEIVPKLRPRVPDANLCRRRWALPGGQGSHRVRRQKGAAGDTGAADGGGQRPQERHDVHPPDSCGEGGARGGLPQVHSEVCAKALASRTSHGAVPRPGTLFKLVNVKKKTVTLKIALEQGNCRGGGGDH